LQSYKCLKSFTVVIVTEICDVASASRGLCISKNQLELVGKNCYQLVRCYLISKVSIITTKVKQKKILVQIILRHLFTIRKIHDYVNKRLVILS